MKRILPNEFHTGYTKFTNLHHGLDLQDQLCRPLPEVEFSDLGLRLREMLLVEDVEDALANDKGGVEIRGFFTKSGNPEHIYYTVEEIWEDEELVERVVTFK